MFIKFNCKKLAKNSRNLEKKNAKVCSFLKSKTSIFQLVDLHDSFYLKQMKKTFTFILIAFLILPVLSQSNDEQKLRNLISVGCLSDGSLKRRQSTGEVFYRKQSVKQPSKQIDFYANMTYRFTDGSNSGKWVCPELSQNSSNSSSSSSDAAVALFLGMLESSSGSSNNSSSYSNENEHNSYQCNRCALVSRSTKEPGAWEFGGNGGCNGSTISGKSHDWNKANTNKGWQCTRCGIQSFLIKGEPGAWEFGGNGACNGGSHYWRSF